MKVNYTLPGQQPEIDVGKDLIESFDSPFRNRLQAFERRQPVAWNELLGLNRTPPDSGQFAAPVSSSDSTDITVQRQRWRELLARHSSPGELKASPEPVRRMLTLLEGYQKEADNLFARGLAGER